jgi:hypothetical protein
MKIFFLVSANHTLKLANYFLDSYNQPMAKVTASLKDLGSVLNRVGSEGLIPSLSSHTTVRAVRHTAV